MKTHLPTVHEQLVYIVQDYDEKFCSAHSSLADAAVAHQHVLDEGLTREDITELLDEYGEEDFFAGMATKLPTIIVYKLDVGYIESYNTTHEIQHALEGGEQYD